MNSSVSVSRLESSSFHLLNYVLDVNTVHKLCYRNSCLMQVALEDWTHKLNAIHLDFIQRNINLVDSVVPVVLPGTMTITSLSTCTNSTISSSSFCSGLEAITTIVHTSLCHKKIWIH